ncbi:hypothetical protein GDO81_001050 [Engystomops pustulosus]|uniref:Scaffold protein Tuba n=1 Tax=Engystomops pustulosus TaxID=76066 RepID=A0AAV7D9J3_ENGPU|nr:hypothetical protein GDO81_001050 [Engystomops pustulosus]
MTLLSSQPEVLEESPSATSTTENSEMRMLEKRSKVIEELLQTERDYLRDLETCVEHIMRPLQATQMTNVDFDVLFGNIHSVISVTQMLLGALENCDSVGLIFLEQRMELECVYKEYCQNHEETIALLESYEKNEKFQRSLHECMETVKSLYQEWGRTNYINLGSFLIKPVQRIMRYPLLLMELQGATPESHPDKNPIREAVRAAKEINVNINEYKRRKDLVVKYRKGDEESLIDKIYKLNIHSIIKKSNRVSSHLKHLTDSRPPCMDLLLQKCPSYHQIRQVFEETEELQMQERLLSPSSGPLCLPAAHQESACLKVLAAYEYVDLYSDKGAVTWRTVQKRFCKLLDYHNCTERAEPKDKDPGRAASARNYEALNAQLLDELAQIPHFAKELFPSCPGYANAHSVGDRRTGREPDALFQEEHSKVQALQSSLSSREPSSGQEAFERKTIERQSARKTVPSPVYYAVYSFKARSPNELSVTANQRLKILEFET